jgi:hypothetical protein
MTRCFALSTSAECRPARGTPPVVAQRAMLERSNTGGNDARGTINSGGGVCRPANDCGGASSQTRDGLAWIDEIIATCDKLFREAAITTKQAIDSEQFRVDAAARVKTMLKGS